MPCFDYGSTPSSNAQYRVDELEEEASRLRKRNHKLMRAICEMDNLLMKTHGERYPVFALLTVETQKLILKHRADDARRGK